MRLEIIGYNRSNKIVYEILWQIFQCRPQMYILGNITQIALCTSFQIVLNEDNQKYSGTATFPFEMNGITIVLMKHYIKVICLFLPSLLI